MTQRRAENAKSLKRSEGDIVPRGKFLKYDLHIENVIKTIRELRSPKEFRFSSTVFHYLYSLHSGDLTICSGDREYSTKDVCANQECRKFNGDHCGHISAFRFSKCVYSKLEVIDNFRSILKLGKSKLKLNQIG